MEQPVRSASRRGRAPGVLTSAQIEARAQKIAGLLGGLDDTTQMVILERSGALEAVHGAKPVKSPVSEDGKVNVVEVRRDIIRSMTELMHRGDANAARVLNQAIEDLEMEANADAFHIFIMPFDVPDRLFVHRREDGEPELRIREQDGSTREYVPCR